MGGLTGIHIRNSFYLSYFLFGDSILHVEMFRRYCPGKTFCRARIVWGDFFVGRGFSKREILRMIIISAGKNIPLGGMGFQRKDTMRY